MGCDICGRVDSLVKVEGVQLNLDGLQVLPGLVNAHDHLHFALFPRLGSGPYANAEAWARDIYHPDVEPIRSQLTVPKHLRLIWGGLRNLLAGVTTVCHHDEYHPIFDSGFPVRVVKKFGWAHSLAFTRNVRERFNQTPPDAPFAIHLAEGSDEEAAEEIFRLHEMGALSDRTILIHSVGLTTEGWDLVRRANAAVVWCPRSNLFTLGRTLDHDVIESGIRIALGSDSPLTSEGDLLDEIRFVHRLGFDPQELVTTAPQEILKLSPCPNDWIAVTGFGAPPSLVVIGEEIRLISPELAALLPCSISAKLYPLQVEERPPVLVRWDTFSLFKETLRNLGRVLLGGREVCV
jgi:cytosine/adenosine deaminase-related metal-dependent hydrolase